MFYLESILLTFIVAFIVDYSGFPKFLEGYVSAIRKYRPGRAVRFTKKPWPEWPGIRPFDCSLCMSFWCGVILCAFRGFTVPHLAFVCFAAFLARFIGEGIFLLEDFLASVISVLTTKLENLWKTT